MNEEYNNTIILQDEEGNDCVFEILDFLEHNNEYYVFLYPEEDDDVEIDDEGAEVIIRRLENCKEESRLVFDCVEDEDLLTTLFEMFKARFWEKHGLFDEED